MINVEENVIREQVTEPGRIYVVSHMIDRQYLGLNNSKAMEDNSQRTLTFEGYDKANQEFEEQCTRAAYDMNYAETHNQQCTICHVIQIYTLGDFGPNVIRESHFSYSID